MDGWMDGWFGRSMGRMDRWMTRRRSRLGCLAQSRSRARRAMYVDAMKLVGGDHSCAESAVDRQLKQTEGMQQRRTSRSWKDGQGIKECKSARQHQLDENARAWNGEIPSNRGKQALSLNEDSTRPDYDMIRYDAIGHHPPRLRSSCPSHPSPSSHPSHLPSHFPPPTLYLPSPDPHLYRQAPTPKRERDPVQQKWLVQTRETGKAGNC